MLQVPPANSLLAGRADWPMWFAGSAVILLVGALISIWWSPRHGSKAKWVWTAIVVVPILGPLGWFVLGRERKKRRAAP
jgi:hypothetical protein